MYLNLELFTFSKCKTKTLDAALHFENVEPKRSTRPYILKM